MSGGAGSPAGPFEGRLLDGISARPRTCEVRLGAAELRLAFPGGGELVLPIGQVISAQEVGTGVHVALPPAEGSAVEQRLEVAEKGFMEALDAHLSRHGGRAQARAQRVGRRIGLRGWAIAAAIVVPVCWIGYALLLPRLHVFVPLSSEAALGEEVYEALGDDWEIERDEEFTRVISRMVEELRDPDLDFDLRVEMVDTDDINAVALPGGRILIFRGLITSAPSPDALAGVLAHEIVHVEQRHSIKSMLRALGVTQFAINAVGGGIEGFELAETVIEASSGLVVLQHSRSHELESDTMAVSKLMAAGRDASGLIEFFNVIQDEMEGGMVVPGWMSTHPATRDRLENTRRLAARQGETTPWMTELEWEEFRERFER